MSSAKKFQVMLSGAWTAYSADEDKILKRAYLAGFPQAKYSLRGQKYEVSFKNMTQTHANTGKARKIREPHKWKAPAKPILEKAGPTFCISVPAGSPGTTIQVPHPKIPGQFIAVNVPASAKVGQAMLIPIPTGEPAAIAASDIKPGFVTPAAPTAPAAGASSAAAKAAPGKKGWSTGGKVAAVAGGAMVVGGLAVGGAVLGEHISEEGWDATMAELGDAADGAGEGIADGAEAAVDWVGDAADTAGDFIMDLF